MVLRLSLVLRQSVLLETKALQLIDRAVDVLAGARQRVEAPGGDPEVDGERQAAVLFADLVVDDPDYLVPVADNRFGPQAEGVVLDGLAEWPASTTRKEWFAITRQLIQQTIAEMDLDPAALAEVEAAFIGAGLL